MADETVPWYVAERSEALAGLLLTSRKDVSVRIERKEADGVDFLVTVSEGEAFPTRLFAVQVKGTTSSDPNVWMQTVREIFRVSASTIFLPTCVVVVNVRDNRLVYAWVAEPIVEGQQATLRFPAPVAFHELDPSALEEIVNRVKGWYSALPRQAMPAAG